MSLIVMEPFRELTNVHERLNRLFDEAHAGYGRRYSRGPSEEAWKPPVNVYETDESIVLELELPGLERDEIQMEVDDGALTIKGERKAGLGGEERQLRVERNYGAFERAFALPTTVDADAVRASLRNGLLQVVLPKRPEAAKRSIAVESS